MIIHVVQQGETIQSIADYYDISATRLILDNGINFPYQLVTGQSIVIVYPEISYTVKPGDTLIGIATSFDITLTQLLMNNPFLLEREYIYPGETIAIKYNKKGKITTHGNTVPYINQDTLRKTLPYLTYLSILNYTATREGDIITYYDDTNIIKITKEYGVMPLMILTTLTITGEANISTAYDLMLSEKYQNNQINNILTILKTKGYYGVNISFQYVNVANHELYEKYFIKISKRLNEEGYVVFVTINPNLRNVNNKIDFEAVDYSILEQSARNIIFMNYEWATTINPPSPISSITNMNALLEHLSKYISPSKEILGLATIGYDWELPYSAGLTSVYSLTYDSAINLAREVGAVIQFDEISQTPYFTYEVSGNVSKVSHIVWFIDARSINALLDLVIKYDLHGIGIWNITVYNTQLWLIINSQFDIEKII